MKMNYINVWHNTPFCGWQLLLFNLIRSNVFSLIIKYTTMKQKYLPDEISDDEELDDAVYDADGPALHYHWLGGFIGEKVFNTRPHFSSLCVSVWYEAINGSIKKVHFVWIMDVRLSVKSQWSSNHRSRSPNLAEIFLNIFCWKKKENKYFRSNSSIQITKSWIPLSSWKTNPCRSETAVFSSCSLAVSSCMMVTRVKQLSRISVSSLFLSFFLSDSPLQYLNHSPHTPPSSAQCTEDNHNQVFWTKEWKKSCQMSWEIESRKSSICVQGAVENGWKMCFTFVM